MLGITAQKGTSLMVVIPHFICGAAFFLVLCFLTLFSTDAFSGHYFHPKLLAITHIAALGWGTMIIFGALYQLLPAILNKSLYSETLAKITFYLFTTGIIVLAYSFWNFNVGLSIQLASGIILLSFFLFITNLFMTIEDMENSEIETKFIIMAAVWLLYTGVMGVLMAFNFSIPFLQSHLQFLKIHAHMGVVGWFVLLIIGVTSKLIPMFLLSQNLNRKKLSASFYTINVGLIGLSADLYFRGNQAILTVYTVIIMFGLIFYLTFIYEAYAKRVRKQLDIGLKHSFVAMLFLLLPVVIGIIISFNTSINNAFLMKVYMVYGISIFFGFISMLILGQTFKTLPFIVWLHRYNKSSEKNKMLLPRNLYSEKIANSQFLTYLLALPLIIFGVLFSSAILIKTGAICLLITGFLYNINVFKIISHLLKIDKNYENI